MLPIAVLVGLSAAVRFLSVRSFDAPWIAPDEMIYGLIGRSFWATGETTVLGVAAPFYGAYPLLVGLPLHLFGTVGGITAIQLGQSILMSSAAAVVWAWARPLAGERWALVAAALTVCLPALAYSGLLMSEGAFFPAGTLALWFTARTLAEPTYGRQVVLIGAIVLAASARLQGAVLVPIVISAALAGAWFARDGRLLLRMAPTWVAIGSLGLLWVGSQLALHGSLAASLGAYGSTASSGYDASEVARWVFRHLGDLFLLVAGIPLVALGVLGYGAARGREADPAARALIAVALSTTFWIPVQVGAFASRYVGQLAERDLIVAAPPLFVCLVVWVVRGLPRPQPATSIIAVLVAAPAVLLPIRLLVTPAAVPDAFMTVPLARLIDATSGSTAVAVWTILAASLVALAVIVPRRARALLPLVVGLALAGSTLMATAKVADLTHADREKFFGAARQSWVDDAADSSVAYLYDGNAFWNGVWKTAFWNERIEQVARLPGPEPSPVPGRIVAPRYDGWLFDVAGHALEGRDVVASTGFTFFGEPVAAVQQLDVDQAGLRLWRTPGKPRVSTWTTGLKPNGDIVQPVRMFVYACGPGSLELTLLGKQGTPVKIDVNGVTTMRVTPAAGTVWTGSVPAPASADGTTRCTFDLRSTGLVGSTRIEFVRA